MNDLESRLEQLSALAEPVRRALYAFVVSQREPVTREQAAAGVDVAVHVAKFHLDRLVEDGLLTADYRRPPGRSGPGAGRPAKVYRRSTTEVEVSLPERRYDVAGRLLVRAISDARRTGAPVGDALHDLAAESGRAAGARTARGTGRRKATMKSVMDALVAQGYEPYADGESIRMANCPFDALAREDTDLVCRMNLAYLEGVLEGTGASNFEAVLDPVPGECCVRVCKA